MKTVKSLADLHRLAMERGSTVVVSGRTINAAAEKLRVRPPRPAPAAPKTEVSIRAAELPAPSPVVAAGLSLGDVEKLLAEQEARWEARWNAKVETPVAAPAVEAKSLPSTWKFMPEYGKRGELLTLKATPASGSSAVLSGSKPQPSSWSFAPEYGPRGELLVLTATPIAK